MSLKMHIIMPSAMLALSLTLATGFAMQVGSGSAEGRAEGLRPVNYPPEGLNKFSEEQVIKKELQVTTQWQTVTFEKPLQINRKGTMGLHLVVDQAPYISTMDDHPLNPECNKAECYKNAYSLRRLSDGALVRPEAVLVGDNGVEVTIRPEGHLYPYFDKHVMTVALRTFKDVNSPSPPFPEGIKTFTSLRIRSTTPFFKDVNSPSPPFPIRISSTAPFWVRYLWWSVDRYPYHFER